VAIFHKLVWPILVIKNIKGKFLTFLFIFGYLLELCLEISQSFSDFFSIFGFFSQKIIESVFFPFFSNNVNFCTKKEIDHERASQL